RHCHPHRVDRVAGSCAQARAGVPQGYGCETQRVLETGPMPTLHLTDRFCAGAKPSPKGRVDYFDEKTPGLSFRVSETGVKTWTLHFTSPKHGMRARVTLGRYPQTSIARARTLPLEARGELDRGNPRDPRDVFG